MQRYRIAFQYVGTKYNGFAKQPNISTTVQEIISVCWRRSLFFMQFIVTKAKTRMLVNNF